MKWFVKTKHFDQPKVIFSPYFESFFKHFENVRLRSYPIQRQNISKKKKDKKRKS